MKKISFLSIIIPVFNEQDTIAILLYKVLKQHIGNCKKEVIVVDDCSTDRTIERIKPFADKIKFLQHKTNHGKGKAIQTGLKIAKGDAIIIQDADLEYDQKDIPVLLKEMDETSAQAVYGSRNIKREQKGYFLFTLGAEVLTGLVNLFYGSNLTDLMTCYKLFRTSLIKSIDLASNGFEFESEVTCKILKQGIQIREVPIKYYPRTFKQGKKISAKDGFANLWTIFKNRF